MKIGEIVRGKITGIKDYGAFVKIANYTGLIHISEFSDDYVKNIANIVTVGDSISVSIVEIDEMKQELKLSYKKANIFPTKLHQTIPIVKGFNALEINLKNWIKEAKERIKKEEENEH